MDSPNTLLLLTNQELWPGIICASHFKPGKVILLHGNTPAARKEPAERLAQLLKDEELVSQCELCELDDDDLVDIHQRLDELELPRDGDVAVGINGATKLMAVACFDWARRRGLQTFYLETDNELQRFLPQDGQFSCQTDRPDMDCLDDLDPFRSVEAHLHRSELKRRGRLLELSPYAQQMDAQGALKQFQECFYGQRSYGAAFLMRDGNEYRASAGAKTKEGDFLELLTALALLKLGVKMVVQGMHLSIRETRAEFHFHAELDLVFIRHGRLWVVECKDHASAEKKGRKIWRKLNDAVRLKQLDIEEQELIDGLRFVAARKRKKTMKERLLAAQECGGALSQVIFVSKEEPRDDVKDFARQHQVHLARRDFLLPQLERLFEKPPRPR